ENQVEVGDDNGLDEETYTELAQQSISGLQKTAEAAQLKTTSLASWLPSWTRNTLFKIFIDKWRKMEALKARWLKLDKNWLACVLYCIFFNNALTRDCVFDVGD
ncbi:hypothetical protein ACJX0J_017924, partial [Zea mays]